jgi:hypothetical protein
MLEKIQIATKLYKNQDKSKERKGKGKREEVRGKR